MYQKTIQRQRARDLYFNSTKTQKQIAEEVGVTQRTIENWVSSGAWSRLKQASVALPAVIADNLCAQIVQMQEHIFSREQNNGLPDKDESLVISRLILSLARIKKYPGMAMNYEIMINFSSYIGSFDKDFNKKLVQYADDYFHKQVGNSSEPPCHLDSGKDGSVPGLLQAHAAEIPPVTEENSTPSQPENCPPTEPKNSTHTVEYQIDNTPSPKDTPDVFPPEISRNLEAEREAALEEKIQAAIKEQERLEQEKIKKWESLPYVKPDGPDDYYFFAQYRHPNGVTVRLSRSHPNRDPEMIRYFDQKFGLTDAARQRSRVINVYRSG